MQTKGQKIINAIGRENKRPYNFGDIMQASHAARQAGTFTANDVADLLRWAYMVAIDASGNRDAIENMRREYERSVDEIREKALEDITEANRRADDEYERAREEFGRRAEEAEDRIDQYRDEAEEYESLRDAIGEDIFFALCEMTPVSHCLPCDTAKVVEAIENCGKFNGFGQLALAV